ncbi:type VII secretion protein EssC [Actinomycetes bacterium NPDC127524]
MERLWIFYSDAYQHFSIESNHPGTLTIGNEERHTCTVRSFSFKEGPIELQRLEGSRGYHVIQNSRQIGELNHGGAFSIEASGETMTICFSAMDEDEHVYYIGNLDEWTVSPNDGADIQKEASKIHEDHGFEVVKLNGQWMLVPGQAGSVYVNGHKAGEARNLEIGDVVFSPFLEFSLLESDLVKIKGAASFQTELTRTLPPISEMQKNYPHYRRTPRMVYDLPDDKVAITFPAQEADDHQRGLWLMILPPLLMMIVMGVVAYIQPRGIFILISIVMFTTTIFTSTVQYIKDRKSRKKRESRRLRVYTRYLEQKREELHVLSKKQEDVLQYHFPSFERMKYMAGNISARIWERTADSGDFLHFRIGKATIPSSYTVTVGSNDMSNRDMDDLLEEAQELVSTYKYIKNVPLAIDLSHGSMGLVGKSSIVKNELQQLIGQLAFFHSYHDVRFVAIFNEEDYKEWEWMKWLPHFQLPHSYAKGFVYNEQNRDQLLSSLYQMIRERDLDEEKEKKRFFPHFVFIVTERNLVAEHVIMEYLEGKDVQVGISAIFATDAKESLSENIHTLVRYINEREGEILIGQGKAVHTPFVLDIHKKEGNEDYARLLRSLNHQKGMNNSIPEMVSFLELHNAKEVKDLQIGENWQVNQSSQSLAVPIGLKGRKDVVELNLHEKAHGPHGLLAGTTGSGKSELLQTYILALSVHYHPHEVAFLLIDYKGGGMAQPFKNIPHLLGTITNIEGSKNFSARALASINSELKKRQRLFDRYEVNHINDYTNLYKEGIASEPLPHLFLISDEFAELKNEEPDFIRELVSAARIGRSLGVHLILATQKPGGIIDNQIWSNARFKISLKVQDAGDSKEILKNADAANITVTGRGYLQVGNNEVYELFQSAWSGAPYLEDTYGAEDEVSIVTDLGLIPISNVPAKSLGGGQEKKTEIEAVVKEILAVQQELKIEKLSSPWLPPLEERIFKPENIDENEQLLPIGLMDEPEKQSQAPYAYNWIEDGNIGIFGSSGYGKSNTVLTLLTGFAEKQTPEMLQYYIFDFGNGALLPLRQLPQTGDYFRIDQERKIEKFMMFIKAEMEKRKQLFTEKEFSGITLYNSQVEKKLPVIYVVLDNFDLVKDELPDLEMQFTQFARDGQSLGIFMILTATRISAIRQPLMNNLKTKIVHYLMDSSEQYSILGRTPFNNEPIPGRALVKKDDVHLMQVYLPAEGSDDLEVLDGVKQNIARLNKKYENYTKPKGIPMLPSRLDIGSFKSFYSPAKKAGLIPIGLAEESVTPVYVDLMSNPHLLIAGQSRKGKTNVLKLIVESLLTQEVSSVAIFDAADRGLAPYAGRENVYYLETKDAIADWLDQIIEAFEEREREYIQAIEQRTIGSLSFEPVLFVIDSITRFQQTIDSKIQDKMALLIKQYSHLGFKLIVSGNASDFTKGYDALTSELKQIRQCVLLMKKSDQSLFTLAYSRKEEEIQPGYGYFVMNGKENKIQIPHIN